MCELPDVLDTRAVVVADCLPDTAEFVSFSFAHAVVNDSVRPEYLGPPPLSGIERLHRLHILTC